MSLRAEAGHGATWAIEMTPGTGVYTTIAELVGDLKHGYKRPVTESTAHTDGIDSSSLGVKQRDPIVVQGNYLYNDPTHMKLYDSFFQNTQRGFQFLGPNGHGQRILSGAISAIDQSNPARTGTRALNFTVIASGPEMVDGVVQGLT